MFRLRNPRFLLAFPTVFCMWLSQDKSLVMVSPKYLLASVVVNISAWSVYVASMIWRLFYLILITVHFDGLKFICQVFSHSSNAARVRKVVQYFSIVVDQTRILFGKIYIIGDITLCSFEYTSMYLRWIPALY
jgi:hypothetical protein